MPDSSRASAIDRIAIVAVTLVALAVYIASLPPSIGWWDTGEYQTVPYIAGILHPTGFPAFIIIGWLFSHGFPFGNIAWRISLMTAIAGALAPGVLVRTARDLGASLLPSVIGALLFAVASITWQHATRAGVETLTLLFSTLAVMYALAWDREQRDRTLIATLLFAGLALATHPVSIWSLPGLAVLVISGCIKRRPSRRTALGAAAAFIAALALYAYLPLRSAAITAAGSDPAARLLGIQGLPFWDYNHTANLANFVRQITGADFGASGSLGAWLSLPSYPAYLTRFGEVAFVQFGWIGVVAIAVGLLVALRTPSRAIALALIAFGSVPFSLAYGVLVDAEKYYLLLVWIFALFAIVGTDALSTAIAGRSRSLRALPFAVLTLAVVNVCSNNAHFFQQRYERNGDPIIETVRTNTPDDAIVFAGWSYVTPLAYAAYAARTLGHRVPVANVSHDRIAEFARRYHVFYLPFPENELAIPNARLISVANSYPPLYRVESTQNSGADSAKALSSQAHSK